MHVLDLDAFTAQQVLAAQKGFVFGEHDARNAVEQAGASTHVARRECGVHLGVGVSGFKKKNHCNDENTYRRALIGTPGQPSRILQCVHLAMQRHALLLDALVVAAAEQLSVSRNECGTNRDSAFGVAWVVLANE